MQYVKQQWIRQVVQSPSRCSECHTNAANIPYRRLRDEGVPRQTTALVKHRFTLDTGVFDEDGRVLSFNSGIRYST